MSRRIMAGGNFSISGNSEMQNNQVPQMRQDFGWPKVMRITEHFCIKVLEEPYKFFLRRKGVNLEAIFDAEPDAGLLCMFHNFRKPVRNSRIIIKFSAFSDCFLPPV